MKTFATMFSGFGGADVGLMAAGLRPLWGVEYDADIAGVYRNNIGDHVIIDDVRNVDYSLLPHVDWLHASPSCVRASVANVDATESAEDTEAAQAVVRALLAHKPQVFTLENVWGYRNFSAFRLILDTIGDMGYFCDLEHVNSADFGVPQTRRRLILRAVHGALLPPLPMPVRWVGWHEAIADLIPTLPDSKLAQWQLARLPQELTTMLVNTREMHGNEGAPYTTVEADKPTYTLSATSTPSRHKAFLVDGKLGSESTNMTTRNDAEPCFTVTTSHNQRDMRAVLVNESSTFEMRAADAPSAAQVASERNLRQKAILPHRVVAMTPRCLARFQSFPDSYELPDKRSLAAKGIGNAVPPLLMQRIAEVTL